VEYSITIIVLFVLELLYFKVADHYNIIDKPNHRSSHTSVTLRGGGIIFPLAMLVACIMLQASILFTLAVVLVGIVSFIDDIRPLHQVPRLLAHLFSVTLIVYDLQLLNTEFLLWLPLVYLMAIGWINAFNFMDGINGITVLYAGVSIATFAWCNQANLLSFELLIVMGLACIVFAFFNLRKEAKTFAGDVGSVSMAVFLAYFMIKIIAETEQTAYILFFAVYGIDSVITIFYRLKNRENIFQPHRSHLYQYLANEMKWPHVVVSILYAAIQLLINIVVLYLIKEQLMSFTFFIIILLTLVCIYLAARYLVNNRIAIANA